MPVYSNTSYKFSGFLWYKIFAIVAINIAGQPRRLMKRLLPCFNADWSIAGVKSKIVALLAAHVYNVAHAL